MKHGISEGCCYRLIKRFENYLISSKEFLLPNINDLKKEDIVIIDSTEIEIQR